MPLTPEEQAELQALMGEAKAAPTKPKLTFSRAVDVMTPLGSMKEIAGQLSGTRPNSALKAGLSAADIASLGLGGLAMKGVAKGGTVLARMLGGLAPQLAAGAGGGAAMLGAEQAGAGPMGQLAASLLGGSAAAGAALPRLPKPEPSALLAELKALGGKPSAAQEFGGPITKALDYSARTNPLVQFVTGGAARRGDESMAQAVEALAQKRFGPMGNLEQSSSSTLLDALAQLKNARAQRLEPALKALEGVPGGAAPGMKDAITRSVAQASGDVSAVSADKFQRALKAELDRKADALGLQKALSSVKNTFGAELGAAATDPAIAREFGILKNAATDAYYAALNKAAPEKALGDQLGAALAEYGSTTGAMSPLQQLMSQASQAKPEQAARTVLGSGSNALGDLLAELGRLRGGLQARTQGALGQGVLASARDAGGAVSPKALETAMGKRYPHVMPLLGQAGTDLKDVLEAAKLAGVGALGGMNPSGTASRMLEQGAIPKNLFDLVALSRPLLEAVPALGYTLGGKAAASLAMAVDRTPKLAALSAVLQSLAGPSIRRDLTDQRKER